MTSWRSISPVYEIYLERAAEKDLKKLDTALFNRAVTQIKGLSKNPRPYGCRKIAGSTSDWRIRVGDYRIIYEIDGKAKSIRVMRVKHRGAVYR